MASVGTHIKRLRAARGLTQEALAERLFVTRQAVSAWETGKALPDVETLERIAAALEADVTEVIYGVPQAPDLRRVKRRWAVIGASLAIILAVIYIILHNYGFIGTWRYGLRYQFYNQNYFVAMEELPEAYSLELDLTALESNVGKALYEDGSGCRITVERLEPTEYVGGYKLIFRAEGVCTPSGGQLVSGCYDQHFDKMGYTLERSASMRTTAGGALLPPSYHCLLTSLEADGNSFGFYVYPGDAYHDSGPPDGRDAASAVTVTVTGLTRITTERLPHLSPFS
ncbi:MAG: helix-turn-helix transcriptional regulator [Oscillospiraceae bacterium]|nr:helix-turn-helix transcriptional regulator [Oscillospiraceae bacterium]